MNRRNLLALALALPVTLTLAPALPVLAHGGHSGDSHPVHDVPAEGAPKITSFRIEKDPMSGYNVFITTENFTFTPEDSGKADVDGNGHAHLYIAGSKIARMYGPALHLTELPFGPHDFRVSLNTNNHSEYAVTGRPIEARIEFTVD